MIDMKLSQGNATYLEFLPPEKRAQLTSGEMTFAQLLEQITRPEDLVDIANYLHDEVRQAPNVMDKLAYVQKAIDRNMSDRAKVFYGQAVEAIQRLEVFQQFIEQFQSKLSDRSLRLTPEVAQAYQRLEAAYQSVYAQQANWRSELARYSSL